MIQQCPHCGYKVALNEQRYKAGSTVIRQCPRCGNDVTFKITTATSWVEELRQQERELAALLAKRQQEKPSDKHPSTGIDTPKGGDSKNRRTKRNCIVKYFFKAFRHYADFKGRASRKEFWMFFLFGGVFAFVTGFIDGLISGFSGIQTHICFILYYLIILFPVVSIAVRRLHDTGRSGWYNLIYYVPYIVYIVSNQIHRYTQDDSDLSFLWHTLWSVLTLTGSIILLVLLCQKGDAGNNDYGPEPNDDGNDGSSTLTGTTSAPRKKTGWIIAVAIALIITIGIVVIVNQRKANTESYPEYTTSTPVAPDSPKQEQPNVTANSVTAEVQYHTITVGDVSFRMVRVAGGSFTMGATSEQGDDADDDEYPSHQVTLSSYWIGETEVMQQLWKEVMGDNPSYFKGDDLPVETVSYDDVQQFIQRLNQRTGRRFRLPTEAEWEYAARGGRNSRGYKYSGSDNVDEVAWYDGNSNKSTHPVKQKQPNELGLYDMSGNVWEWCSDWYENYSSASQTDPRGAASGSYRVLRGGSWYFNASYNRSSNRIYFTPGYCFFTSGFRLALSE